MHLVLKNLTGLSKKYLCLVFVRGCCDRLLSRAKIKEEEEKNYKMSPQNYPTYQPEHDHVRIFQASWVVEVDWKKPTRTI